MHVDDAPSPWVVRFAGAIRPGGRVLDVACGAGRHARFLAACGFAVDAVDRDPEALAGLTGVPRIHAVRADLERDGGRGWPFASGETWDAVVVTRYLWRPLWPRLLAAVAPGGLYVHETFALGQQAFGRPQRAAFLLRVGELLDAVRGPLAVLAYEDGIVDGRARVQRIAARRGEPGDLPST